MAEEPVGRRGGQYKTAMPSWGWQAWHPGRDGGHARPGDGDGDDEVGSGGDGDGGAGDDGDAIKFFGGGM